MSGPPGGPPPGIYRIKSALGPFIGANIGGPANVVADGPESVFTLSKLEDGNYTLSVPEGFTREDHGNVVASPIKLPPGIWIEVPNATPRRGWSLYDTHPNAYVAVGDMSNGPQKGQLWNFEWVPK
ncbi:hypothetical protein OG21DRAFT_1523994 [Imleria badia]|nr:hypothetical protein OG21DRAFT_1523994 [Imleria badia]